MFQSYRQSEKKMTLRQGSFMPVLAKLSLPIICVSYCFEVYFSYITC